MRGDGAEPDTPNERYRYLAATLGRGAGGRSRFTELPHSARPSRATTPLRLIGGVRSVREPDCRGSTMDEALATAGDMSGLAPLADTIRSIGSHKLPVSLPAGAPPCTRVSRTTAWQPLARRRTIRRAEYSPNEGIGAPGYFLSRRSSEWPNDATSVLRPMVRISMSRHQRRSVAGFRALLRFYQRGSRRGRAPAARHHHFAHTFLSAQEELCRQLHRHGTHDPRHHERHRSR